MEQNATRCPENALRIVADDTAKWAKLVKAANLSVE
jgi:hypothetical protein